MARKKKEAAHENHERWLVSYADFITLLFAFFVVMFASSQTDKSRAKQRRPWRTGNPSVCRLPWPRFLVEL